MGADLAYTKLFHTIITSTIWMEDDPTRIVWITMLAMADKNGEVQASVPGLARVAGVATAACERALQLFLSPDKDSRTKVLEGRRIQEIDGGWLLINHEKYRLMASKEESKAKAVARVQRWRENHRDGKRNETPVNDMLTHGRDIADTDSDSDTDKEESPPADSIVLRGKKHGTRLPKDWKLDDDGRRYATERRLSPDETAAAFRDYWHASNAPSAVKRDWSAAFRTWCRRSSGDGYRDGGKGASPVRARRGNDSMLEQLSIIANRRDEPE